MYSFQNDHQMEKKSSKFVAFFWGRNVADTHLCNYSNGKLKFCVLTDVDSFKSPFLLDYLFIVTGLDITFQKHL